MIGFLTVVQSIDSADWVDEMPSLYPIAFLGLVLGLVPGADAAARARRAPGRA